MHLMFSDIKRTLLPLLMFISSNASFSQTSTRIEDGPFNIGVIAGAGSSNNICVPCKQEELLFGYHLGFQFGVQIRPKINLEIASYYWTTDILQSEDKLSSSQLYGQVSYSPFKKENCYFKLSVGYGNYFFTPALPILISDSIQTLGSVVGSGFSLGVGGGYNFEINRIKIGPTVLLNNLFIGDLRANEQYVIKNQRMFELVNIGVLFQYNFGKINSKSN